MAFRLSMCDDTLRARAAWFPALLVASLGCGSSEYAPVTGLVTYNGEPVANATVRFSMVEGGGGLVSIGETNAEGRYELVTQGSTKQDGARVGMNRVAIIAIDVQESNPSAASGSLGSIALINAPPPKERSRLPIKYQSFEESGLQFEVPPGGSSQADFAITD